LRIFIFDISYSVGFVLISFFIAYYLFASSIIADYSDSKYTAMKVMGSFYIGSIDIFDKVLNDSYNVSKKSIVFDE